MTPRICRACDHPEDRHWTATRRLCSVGQGSNRGTKRDGTHRDEGEHPCRCTGFVP